MRRVTADWLSDPLPTAVIDALDGQGYFVGGCVRNALMGAGSTDIDIATPLVPEAVIERLEAADLKVVPTGVAHGTVTAARDGRSVEVTTFRADVATDGRRAVVAFTTDMAIDAARRDFTINALYADATGAVIDPLNGFPDLESRRVRFIGEAGDRIREDYLRILRFFRFHAWYGAAGIDPEGLAACARLADGIAGLARERIGWEFRKLLGAPDPAPALASMSAAGVLARCLPGADPALIAPFVDVEEGLGIKPDWQRRLVALTGSLDTSDTIERLRLSRSEAKSLEDARAAMTCDHGLAVKAYRYGEKAAWTALMMDGAAGLSVPVDASEQIRRGARAVFPVAAKDLIAAGNKPGRSLGDALRRAEEHWIATGLSLDKRGLLRNLADKTGAVDRG